MNIAKISNKSSIFAKNKIICQIREKIEKRTCLTAFTLWSLITHQAQKLQRHWNHPVLSREKHAWELSVLTFLKVN